VEVVKACNQPSPIAFHEQVHCQSPKNFEFQQTSISSGTWLGTSHRRYLHNA
jgi:hypothetical protein